MRVILALGALFLAADASGRSFSYAKKVRITKLDAEFRAAGFKVRGTTCRGERCTTYFEASEAKDPAPIVAAHSAADAEAAEAAEASEFRRLAMKWKTGSITQAEKDELLKRLVLRAASVGSE